jgi:hypothetical protein
MTTPTTWSTDELAAFETADEVRLTVRRADGTLRRPVTIWIVRVGGDLYVRSVNGPSATWYRPVQERHEGHLEAPADRDGAGRDGAGRDGVGRDVALAAADARLNNQVDSAYRVKYGSYPDTYVNALIAAQARETTLRLRPL